MVFPLLSLRLKASNNTLAPEENVIQSPSPVIWQVAFWVLCSLAANSMAQRSATASDHSLYMHSSPLMCITDALLKVLRIIVTSISLRISLAKSATLSHQLYIDSLPSLDQDEQRAIRPHTWPRWLFFIMGTLPAAIKVASFSGVPMTKACGMMFLTSFVLNEIILLLTIPTYEVGIPEILSQSVSEWEGAENNALRKQVYNLHENLLTLEAATYHLTWPLTLVYLTYLNQILWPRASDFLISSREFQFTFSIVAASPTLIVPLGLSYDIFIRGRRLRVSGDSFKSVVRTPSGWMVLMVPKPWDIWPWGWNKAGLFAWNTLNAVMVPYWTFKALRLVLGTICISFPRVAAALCLTNRTTTALERMQWARIDSDEVINGQVHCVCCTRRFKDETTAMEVAKQAIESKLEPEGMIEHVQCLCCIYRVIDVMLPRDLARRIEKLKVKREEGLKMASLRAEMIAESSRLEESAETDAVVLRWLEKQVEENRVVLRGLEKKLKEKEAVQRGLLGNIQTNEVISRESESHSSTSERYQSTLKRYGFLNTYVRPRPAESEQEHSVVPQPSCPDTESGSHLPSTQKTHQTTLERYGFLYTESQTPKPGKVGEQHNSIPQLAPDALPISEIPSFPPDGNCSDPC